jgi:DNA-binding NarL/FixJ family response regulator
MTTTQSQPSNTGQSTVKVIVVDDHTFMRELISSTLSRQTGGYEVVAEASTAEAAVKACGRLQPDIVILDINLPDRSGIDVVPDIKRISAKTRILLCTAFASEDRLLDSIRSGADGFVEKTNTWDDFFQALRRVGSGERYFCSRSTAPSNPQTDGRDGHDRYDGADLLSEPLSRREAEVLKLIAEGRTSKEIAAALGISVATIETHRAHLMTKLRVRNVAGLITYAFETGLVRLRIRGSRPADEVPVDGAA